VPIILDGAFAAVSLLMRRLPPWQLLKFVLVSAVAQYMRLDDFSGAGFGPGSYGAGFRRFRDAAASIPSTTRPKTVCLPSR